MSKCNVCESINHIRLTMDTDDMKCIKCKQDQCIPDKTEIITAPKWITSKDIHWIC